MQGGSSVENKMFSPSFTFQNQLPQKQSSGSNGTGHSSLSFTPSPCSWTEEEINPSDTENRLYLARLSLQYQQLVDRYSLCITQLQDTANQAELVRQENAKLRVANKDLTKRLAILTQASIQTRYLSSNVPSLSIINDFRSLCLGDNGRAANEVKETSPTSVIGNNRFERKSTERVAMPKSISIRSSGYLRMPPSSSGSSSTTGANIPNQPRAAVTTPVTNDMQQQQRLFVPVGNKEEVPMEFDVYNQGMVKTELCNKWQETGACPYGEHCQFAHGIAELRPVIRHPRYKTEVCRMVLSGDNCPYGHRCHFRHSLTEQERLTRRS